VSSDERTPEIIPGAVKLRSGTAGRRRAARDVGGADDLPNCPELAGAGGRRTHAELENAASVGVSAPEVKKTV
jgi:hypothetical protein